MISSPDMYLWDQSTGALWLWQVTGLSGQSTTCGANYAVYPITYTNCTATLGVTATNLGADTTAGTWNDGTSLTTLQAADITGNPGVIAVTCTGQVESWELSGSTFSQVNATGSAQRCGPRGGRGGCGGTGYQGERCGQPSPEPGRRILRRCMAFSLDVIGREGKFWLGLGASP
jgi:hypothetical protein